MVDTPNSLANGRDDRKDDAEADGDGERHGGQNGDFARQSPKVDAIHSQVGPGGARVRSNHLASAVGRMGGDGCEVVRADFESATMRR